MEVKNVVIIGASGHAKVIIDIFEKMPQYNIVGLLDTSLPPASLFQGYSILGNETLIPELIAKYIHLEFFIAIGDNMIREKVVNKVTKIYPEIQFANAIHPSAVIAKDVQLGYGIAIMAGSVINSSTVIGHFAIINTQASVDHDNTLGDFCTVSVGAKLGGLVHVGRHAVVSIGAVVIHNITIGANTLIAAGSVVINNCHENEVWMGVPAKLKRSRAIGEKYL